jgi:hypothetical protein
LSLTPSFSLFGYVNQFVTAANLIKQPAGAAAALATALAAPMLNFGQSLSSDALPQLVRDVSR